MDEYVHDIFCFPFASSREDYMKSRKNIKIFFPWSD